MKSHSPIATILTTLLVVSFGWGLGYLALKGIESAGPTNIVIETDSQRAELLGAQVVNPTLPKTNVITNKTGLTIIMGGDVMFDRAIRAIGDRAGYDTLFDESVTSLFKNADIAVVNLEGPVTASTSKTLVNGKTTQSFMFTFPTVTAEALAHAGIDIVSLANNHTDNFGFSGFLETKKWLGNANVSWFGNPWNSTSTKMVSADSDAHNSPITTLITQDGITVAFVGYHAFQIGVDRIVAEIKRVSSPNVFTIVMPHWGEEYTTAPSEKIQGQAQAFVAAGADAVIGAHPHVIMNQEWMGAVPVYYSLGNLLFDQYFSPEVMHGLIVELHVEKTAAGIILDHVSTHDVYMKAGVGVSTKQ